MYDSGKLELVIIGSGELQGGYKEVTYLGIKHAELIILKTP